MTASGAGMTVTPGFGASLGAVFEYHTQVNNGLEWDAWIAVRRLTFVIVNAEIFSCQAGMRGEFGSGLIRPFAGLFLDVFFFKQKTAYDIGVFLMIGEDVGMEIVARDRQGRPIARL